MKQLLYKIKKGRAGAFIILLLALPLLADAQNGTLSDLIEQARSAGIEQSRIADLQGRAEARGIADDQLLAILRPAVEMAEKNLPHELIFEKAFEGISKNIPVQRIEPVLNGIMESSERAAAYVDEWVVRPEVGAMLERRNGRMDQQRFRNEMVRAGAKTLSQDFDADTFNETLNALTDEGILDRARPSGILTAMNIMSDLPSAAQEPANTARLVLGALQSGFDASDLQKLPGAMHMAQRRSQLPATAVAEGLSQQLQGGLPASEILQNLFNGEVGGPPGNVPPGLDRNRPGRGQQGGPPE